MLFRSYLTRSLSIQSLGFFERVAESATQYAVRLLRARRVQVSDDAEAIARRLVYSYKDHGFVIDSREATQIFGESVVVNNSPEYRLSNAMFDSLDFMAWVCDRRFSRAFSYVGNTEKGCWVSKKQA